MPHPNIESDHAQAETNPVERPLEPSWGRWMLSVGDRKAIKYTLRGLTAVDELKGLVGGLAPKYHSDFALALLEERRGGDLAAVLGQLQGLSPKVASAMLGQEMANELAEHIDCFPILDPEIGMLLIFGKHSQAVLRNRPKFPGLEMGQAIEWILEVGDFEEIAELLQTMPDLDRMGVVQNLIEGDSPELAAQLIPALDPEDRLPAIDDLGSQWEGDDAIDALVDLYPKLDAKGVVEIAKKLGSWFEVSELLEQNLEIDRMAVALDLIEDGSVDRAVELAKVLSWTQVKTLAERLRGAGHVDEADWLLEEGREGGGR